LVSTQSGLDTVIYSDRNFFGINRVTCRSAPSIHWLLNGTTLHGAERWNPPQSNLPLAYYDSAGPIGQVLRAREFHRVAAIGLGTGSIASYGKPTASWIFFEIDPVVIRIASDPHYFTFLEESPAAIQIIKGDARLSLNRYGGEPFDLLVIDAFGADNVPVHLLTQEALQLYLTHLAPHGWLVFHITNRHLRLRPVLAGLSRLLHLAALDQNHFVSSVELENGIMPSHWVVLARSTADLDALRPLGSAWQPLTNEPNAVIWTDDFSSAAPLFHL
jgi:spermidine synthase